MPSNSEPFDIVVFPGNSHFHLGNVDEWFHKDSYDKVSVQQRNNRNEDSQIKFKCVTAVSLYSGNKILSFAIYYFPITLHSFLSLLVLVLSCGHAVCATTNTTG